MVGAGGGGGGGGGWEPKLKQRCMNMQIYTHRVSRKKKITESNRNDVDY